MTMSFGEAHSPQRRSFWLLLVLLLAKSSWAGSPALAPCASPHPTPSPIAKLEARGISIGAPRAFDNRALTLMLESLNASLKGLNVIDQNLLAQAIGKVQGSQLTEVSREFVLQARPTPQVQTVSGLTNSGSTNLTGSTTTTAAPAGTSTVTQAGTSDTLQTGSSQTETKTIPSVTPGVPQGPSLPGVPSGFSDLKYSLSPSDLLSEQVNVMYQIFNVRMLLDRALGDRLLWDDATTSGKSRLQAVLGTNVWLDPPRDAVNAAAVVEITVEVPDGAATGQRPALVAVMPQERTYNSAALSSKANAFGGSAVVNMFTVGYTEKRRGQTFYLYRENDTVAFEKQADPRKPNTITYGWVFRPVLGRRSVMAGPRQMFAVISLPVDDDPSQTCGRTTLNANVRAYWRKYDPRTLTTAERNGDRNEIRPWAKVGHALSLGTSLTYPPGGETDVRGYTIDVPLTRTLAAYLKPGIEKVVWRPVGTKLAVVAVQGRNLFHDTRVALGDRVLSTSTDGLRLVSDQAFDITTTMSSLFADAAVLGRYGPAEPLEIRTVLKPPLAALKASWNESLGGVIEADVNPVFQSPGSVEECLHPEDLEDDRLGYPILFLNGAPIDGPYQFISFARKTPVGCDETCKSERTCKPEEICKSEETCLSVVARVPEGTSKQLAGVLSLKFPFRGSAFQSSQRIYDPATAIKARLVATNDYLLEQVEGPFGSAGMWRIVIPGVPEPFVLAPTCDHGAVFCLPTPHDSFVRFRPPATYENVLLQANIGGKWVATYPMSLPQSPPKPQGPTLDKGQTVWVGQNDDVWRTFTGSGLEKARARLGDGRPLRSVPSKDGKGIDVLVTSDVTRVARSLDISIVDENGTLIGIAHLAVRRADDVRETQK